MRMDLSAQSHIDQRIRERDNVKGELSNRKIIFTAPLLIGSEEDKVRVVINTGLNLFWVPTRNCDYYSSYKRDTIYEIDQCDFAGVYLPSDLSSFRNTSDVFQWWYTGNYNGAWGYYGTDKVQYGNYSGNITFGIASEADYIGELGLGFPDYQHTSPKSTLNESTFLEQLVEKGDIKSNAYSFQLGINNASEGTLLLGAVDHSKYKGNLQKVKMVDLYNDGSDTILILLDGILGKNFSFEMNVAVRIRMEEATLSFPLGSYDDLLEQLDVMEDFSGYDLVPCTFLNLTDLISFYFSGIEIQVPLRDLVIQSSYYGCTLALNEYAGPPIIGQDILKSAYVVVDLDNKEVALAQATNSSVEDIEDIASEIPLALEAPLYSYTEVAEKYYYSYHSLYNALWHTSLFDVPSRSSYSTNTDSRSVDLGSTTYKLLFPQATTKYDYAASFYSSYGYYDYGEMSYDFYVYSDTSDMSSETSSEILETSEASARSSSTSSLPASSSSAASSTTEAGNNQLSGSAGTTAVSVPAESSSLDSGYIIKCLPFMLLLFSILTVF
ncbi:CIC11C00000004042 [Sungouiella intermedia]|uniref:CIC11C00000004042 n=1 Tax=Sungouiella intermedia TaxID=45354 RepID=A0A1L0DEM1_9ASCO|nr:CIC11C00000004042 [[Candida] intermedia]